MLILFCPSPFRPSQCDVCDKSYYHNDDKNTCDDCKEGGKLRALLTSSAAIALMTLVVVSALVCLYCRYQRKRIKSSEEDTSSLQKRARARWQRAETKLKGLAAFLQIVLNIDITCAVQFPKKFESVMTALSFLNLNVLPALGIQCWFTRFDYIDGMMAVTITPLVIAVLIFLFFLGSSGLAKFRRENQDKQKRRNHFYSFLFLLLTFCILVGGSSSLFLFLKVFTKCNPL
jgi:Na+/H+ antiporter NhaD/arsenite permease-like protein